MAAHPAVLSLKGLKYFIFPPNNIYIYSNKRLMTQVLLGMRFKSSKQDRTKSFSSFDGDHVEHRTRVPADVDYNTLRENSLRLRRLRNEYFSRASQAYSRGQRGLAHILAQKGRIMNTAFKHSEMQSSAKTLRLLNSAYKNQMPSCSKTLNVHGLHVKEAIRAVETFLYYNKDLKGRLTIITGWGRNSYPQEARLLPALKMYLEEHGKLFEEKRPGVIEVIS